MALTPTIYKFRVALSDLDRQVFESLNLTVAQHPSETTERMVTRLLAYCLNTSDNLVFCKGLSDADEADLWEKNLNGNIKLWIDVGEPQVERIKKASRQAETVMVYSFNSKSDTWWSQNKEALEKLPANYYQFAWEQIQALADNVQRTMELSITITDNTLFVSTEDGNVDVTVSTLQM